MKTLKYANEQLIPYLTGQNTIISSKVIEINISKRDDGVDIDIYFNLLYAIEKEIMIRFKNVTEYSFFYTRDYIFYNVEDYKFFKDAKGYYMSLDLFDDKNEISPKDQDYILSKGVEAYDV